MLSWLRKRFGKASEPSKAAVLPPSPAPIEYSLTEEEARRWEGLCDSRKDLFAHPMLSVLFLALHEDRNLPFPARGEWERLASFPPIHSLQMIRAMDSEVEGGYEQALKSYEQCVKGLCRLDALPENHPEERRFRRMAEMAESAAGRIRTCWVHDMSLRDFRTHELWPCDRAVGRLYLALGYFWRIRSKRDLEIACLQQAIEHDDRELESLEALHNSLESCRRYADAGKVRELMEEHPYRHDHAITDEVNMAIAPNMLQSIVGQPRSRTRPSLFLFGQYEEAWGDSPGGQEERYWLAAIRDRKMAATRGGNELEDPDDYPIRKQWEQSVYAMLREKINPLREQFIEDYFEANRVTREQRRIALGLGENAPKPPIAIQLAWSDEAGA